MNLGISPASVTLLNNSLPLVSRIWTKSLPWKESVAEHTMWALILVDQYKKLIEDLWWNPARIQAMLRIHDLPEILTWDIDPRSIAEHTKYYFEEWAMTLLIQNEKDRDLWYEYSQWETLDAQIAKMIDKLQFIEKMLHLWHTDKARSAYYINYRKYFLPFPPFQRYLEKIFPQK